MASPIRSFGAAGQRTGRGGCNPEPLNPQLPVLNVAPLNSVPYIGPPTAHANSNTASVPQEAENKAIVKVGSSLIYMPSGLSEEEWSKLVVATKCGVGLSDATMGKVGPIIGLVDIGECEDSYVFRVSLPGVSRDEKDFSCNVEPDGKILIKGVTTTGEKTVVKESQIFKMQTQNLCPPGHFSVSFQLPGPVDHQHLSGYFDNTGILEGIVKKK